MAEAKQVTTPAERKQELVAQLASARQTVSRGKRELTASLKPRNLIGKLIKRKPKALFAGSLVGGLACTVLLKRPKKSSKSSPPKTAGQILLTWILSMLKPAAKAWLVARAKKIALERATRIRQNPAHLGSPAEQQPPLAGGQADNPS